MGVLTSDADLRFNISRADLERTGDTAALAAVDTFIAKSKAILTDLEMQTLAVYADPNRSDEGKRSAEAELRGKAQPEFDAWATAQIAQVEAQYQAAIKQLDANLKPNDALVQQLAATLPSLSESERVDLYLAADDERRLAMEVVAKQLGAVPTRRSDGQGGSRVVWSSVVDLESDQTREFQRARRQAVDPVLYDKAARLEKLRAKLDGLARDARKLIRDGRIR